MGSHAAFLIRNQSRITRAVGNTEPIHPKAVQEADRKRKSKVRDVGSCVSRLGSSKAAFQGVWRGREGCLMLSTNSQEVGGPHPPDSFPPGPTWLLHLMQPFYSGQIHKFRNTDISTHSCHLGFRWLWHGLRKSNTQKLEHRECTHWLQILQEKT